MMQGQRAAQRKAEARWASAPTLWFGGHAALAAAARPDIAARRWIASPGMFWPEWPRAGTERDGARLGADTAKQARGRAEKALPNSGAEDWGRAMEQVVRSLARQAEPASALLAQSVFPLNACTSVRRAIQGRWRHRS